MCDKKKSSSKQREVTGYLRPSLYNGFDKYVSDHETSKSNALNDAVRLLLDKAGYGINNKK